MNEFSRHKSKVSLTKLQDYERPNIAEAVQKCLRDLVELEKILKPKSSVFVKINCLSPASPPERNINTHPSFTREILRLLKEFDLDITVGDDIRSRSGEGLLISGYPQICEELDVRLVNLKEAGFREVECHGDVLEKTYISSLVLDSDIIINLPKLKTHSFSVYTGAIKNMFGVIPQGLRIQYHRDYQKNEVFSQMLVDIYSCAPPDLTIMDAVIVMEGEGPSSGNLREVGAVLASQDAVAVDAVASKIAGFNPMDIFSTQNAHERGFGRGRLDEIDVVGRTISDLKVKDFKHSTIAVGFIRRKLPAFLYAYFQNQLVFTPEVREDKCTGCWECVSICPPGAAKKKESQDRAWIDTSLCIHCLCCHEVCEFQAVKLRQRPIGRLIRGIQHLVQRLRS